MTDIVTIRKIFFKKVIPVFALVFLLSCKKETEEMANSVPPPTPVPQPMPVSSSALTPRSVSISAHCRGYYEYLPEGYLTDPANTKYPLLIVFHGGSETGGDASSLSKLLINGPLKHIKNGSFPNSFAVNGQAFKFIIIAPQYTSSGNTYPNEIDILIEYAKKNYKVDASRIYLTGLSYGGGLCWSYVGSNANYANKIAAMVPIAAYIHEERQEFKIDVSKAQNILSSNLPIWSTHNSGDRTCPLSWILNAHAILNKTNPTPKLTVFDSDMHGGWNQTYNPSFKENGMNIYEWMLQYHR